MAGCQTPASRPNPELVQRSQPLLGTFVVISVYGADRPSAQSAISDAFAEVQRIDALMSLHRPESELVRLNANAAHRPVEVSPELFRVIAQAQDIARETDGSFDITIRPLAQLWGFIWKEYRLPTAAELDAVLPKVNHQWVELDAAARTVRFLKPGVSLDLGGIAKGYAVDCAVETLRARGMTNVMVRAGGDLRVVGAPPGSTHWQVQLEDPRGQGKRRTIWLRDRAVSTSGNYENFFVVQGQRYSHILNPKTGWPVQGVASCTLIAPSCLESDAWATALFVYGADRSLARFGARLAFSFTLVGPEASPAWPTRTSPSFPLGPGQ